MSVQLPPEDGAKDGEPSTLQVEFVFTVAVSFENTGVIPPSPLFLTDVVGTEGTEAMLPSHGAEVGESSPKGDEVPRDEVEAVLLVVEFAPNFVDHFPSSPGLFPTPLEKAEEEFKAGG
jgi:hypothetical protein